MATGLLYSVVAGPGGTILAECTKEVGNFKTIAEQMLERLPYNTDGKKTYSFQGFNFHSMVSGGLAYVCVSKEAFGVRIPFGFLDDIRMLFVNKYGSKGQTAIAYAMNDEFSRILSQKMDFYSNDTSADKIRAINAQIELVKSQMLDNLEKVIERGDHIEELVVKTEGLKTQTATFKAKATVMKQTLWWKNVKLYILLGFVLLVLGYVVMGAICGFPIFHKCFNFSTGSTSTSNTTTNSTNPPPPQSPPTSLPKTPTAQNPPPPPVYNSPAVAPVKAPVKAPTKSPVKTPVKTPVTPPVASQRSSPTSTDSPLPL